MAQTTRTKAPANYAKLADETELIRDGLASRITSIKGHLNKLLKDVPERAAIMQSFERYAAWMAQHAEVQSRLDRYIALRDRPASEADGASSDT